MDIYKIITLTLLVLLLFMGGVNAVDVDDIDINQTADVLSIDLNRDLESNLEDNIVEEGSNEIVVNDWSELQYYCSLNDKDYTLKLKENTNYYPSDVSDSNCAIIVKNNVRIVGSEGAYIGDSSPQAGKIGYTAIKVEDDSGVGITLENITFKWIDTEYQSDGVFLVMGGNVNNFITNCYFTNISTNIGHSSILHIKKGKAILSNCTFINCTTDFGCLSVYNPSDDPTKLCTRASMEVNDCYFEGNYARTEPGCINNCGILVVNNSTFIRNSAFWWAGAIHTHGGANTTIYDSDFLYNLAGWNGGALYTYSYLQIYNTRFIGNNCTTNNGGGAIGACKYLHAPYIYIEGSLFQNNENLCWSLDDLSTSGTGRGGAISLMDEGSLELYNNIFIKNSASIGTAVCAIAGGLSYGSPDVKIVGNQFINHTRAGDVLDVRVATGSIAEIRDNYFLNNSIVFEKLKLTADDPVNGLVTFYVEASLKNPKSYDEDILEKSDYFVYVNGVYHSTVSTPDFTLNLGKGNTARVYVVPSISSSKSNEVFAGIAKKFIFVSQSGGNDNNDGQSRSKPVKTLAKAIELAREYENIVMMDGTFKETNLNIDYNLTITAENDATVSVTGNAFTITDGDVKFVNVTFKNCKYGSSTKNRLISQINDAFLIFEGCVFQSNEYKAHIEASGTVEGENLIVTGNKDGSFIRSDSIKLKSSLFANNIATYTIYNSLLVYNTQTVKFEVENLTFIGNTVDSGCINLKKGSGTVIDCTFDGNRVNSGKGSAIFLDEGSALLVQSSKFINNVDIGRYSSVIYLSSGTLVIKDSILINNTYENSNNVIINGQDSALKKITANNNWWGNTQDNLTKPALKVFPKSNQLPNGWDPASCWLVLNTSCLAKDIELNKPFPVKFTFTQIDNEGNVSAYDSYYMPSFDLDLSAVNGTCDDNVKVEKGVAITYFTLTDKNGGSITSSFNEITSTFSFKYVKIPPAMTINVPDIYVGQTAEIEVILDSSVTGDLIVKVGNITQTKHIYDSTTFAFPDLPVGTYTVEVNYTGDELYESVVNTAVFGVNKLPSDINIICGEIELGKDVVFNFNVTAGATGSIDIFINSRKQATIAVSDSYTIANISRGDYIIKAIYMGDGNHLESEDELSFDVGKFAPTITVSVGDTTYGDDTVVNVSLNDTATGNVTITIDGKSVSKTLDNAQTTATFSNLDAGEKTVTVSYTGDNNYKKGTAIQTFNIAKAVLDFTISSNNIKLGREAVVEITLPPRCGGTVTFTGIKTDVKNVPLSGIVKITYEDLENGTYTVTAEYNGDNYQTLSKSTSFTVSLWNEPQWANEGGDITHSGKSPYDSSVNGELKWSGELEEITGNLVVDSEGNLYVATANKIYSFDADGKLRWTYSSTGAGDYFSGISISRDVIISPNADDTLYFINQTTGERYGHANLYQGSSSFAPVVDFNGNIYISGQGDANNPNLVIIPYKIWETGGNPIVISLGKDSSAKDISPTASPTIMGNDIVIVPSTDGIKIFNITSETLLLSRLGKINVSCVVGDGDTIYSILGDSIVAFSLSSTGSWSTKVTGGVGNHLAIDKEQGIYAVNANGDLYRYDLIDGSESKFTNLTLTSGILIGNEGNVYFASNDTFYALDLDGNILWKSKLDSKITGTPIMDKNGIIYLNSANKVYALKQSSLKDANLSIDVQNIYTNQIETLTITFNENATGKVEITINNDTITETIKDGKIVKTLGNLTSGNYDVTVKYMGDLRFTKTTKSSSFSVLKSNPNMNVFVNNINVGDDALFTIDLPANAKGTVTVNVNGKINSTSDINDGKVNLVISALTYGNYNYTVIYSGDGLYNSSQKSGEFSVGKTRFEFTVNPLGNVNVDSPVEFLIGNIPSDASGSIIVEVGELSNASKAVNGQASVIFNGLAENNYTAYVKFVNDDKYMADTKSIAFRVVKSDVSFDVDVSDINVGEIARFTLSNLPNDAIGMVTVNVDTLSYSNSTNNGLAVVNIAGLSYGAKKATITFAGDDKYNSKTITKEFNVNKIDPSFNVNDVGNLHVSESAVFKAVLNPDAFGEIVVTVNGVAQGIYQVSNGTADIRLNSLTYGNKTVVLSYLGNYKYAEKSITKNFVVEKYNPVFIVGDISDINVGQNAIFNIELPADVTGIVNITVGDISKQITAKSNLQISIPIFEEGFKTASVTYLGDSKYLSKTVLMNFTVTKYDSNLICDVENTNYGNITKFVITLYPNDVTGSVDVTVDGVTHSTLVSGAKAIIEFANLTVGNKTAIISYSGDEKYKSLFNISKSFSITNDSHDVPKINASVNVVVDDIYVGDAATFIIDLNSDATGTILVNVDGISNSSSISYGKASVVINGLTGGSKKASIIYNGDDKYLSNITFKQFNVNKHVPSVSVSYPDSINIGQVMIFTVNLDSDAVGIVSVRIGDFINSTSVIDGAAVISFYNLTKGSKTAAISYSGDSKYESAALTKEFNVNLIKPTINVETSDITAGEVAIFDVELNPDATGIVSVSVDGKFNLSNLIGGKAIISISGLTYGIKEATINYIGDTKYLAGSALCNISVNKNNAPITVNVDDIYYGSPAKVDVTLPENAGGIVKLIIGENTFAKMIANSKAEFIIDNLDAGEKTFSIVYLGDNNFNENSTTHNFNVKPVATVISDIIIVPIESKITAVLKDGNSKPVANALITYVIDGVVKNTTTSSTGSFAIDSDAGKTASIYFNGNANLLSTNKSVTIPPLGCVFNIKYGVQYSVYAVDYSAGERGKILKFQLLDSFGRPIEGASIKLTYGKSVVYKTTDAQGFISFGVDIQSSGLYKSSLYYAGSGKYNSTSVSFSIKVNKKPITISASAKTFKAKVKTKKYTITLKTKACSSKNSKVYLKSGKKVTLKIKGKTYTAKINSKGKATFKITKLTKKGKYTATVKFAGDKTYNAASKKVKITIK